MSELLPWETVKTVGGNGHDLAANVPEWATGVDVSKCYGAVTWLWPRFIPNGHVTLLVGPQGGGKSFLAAHLMAVVTAGLEAWPDGEPYTGGAGEVILVETESMRGETMRRCEAAGGVLTRVKFPSSDPLYIPTLPKDVARIEELADFTRARLIVIDSLSGGAAGDENSGGDMRTVLTRLAALAARLNVGVLAVHHLRKKSQLEPDRPTLDRVRGSSAISQYARSVIALWRPDGESDGPVRVESLKSSFCKPPEPFGFTIGDNGLTFGDAPDVEPKAATVHERACEFLRVELQSGPRRAADILHDAELAGYSRPTLYKAKSALRVVSVQRPTGWEWGLPHV